MFRRDLSSLYERRAFGWFGGGSNTDRAESQAELSKLNETIDAIEKHLTLDELSDPTSLPDDARLGELARDSGVALNEVAAFFRVLRLMSRHQAFFSRRRRETPMMIALISVPLLLAVGLTGIVLFGWMSG